MFLCHINRFILDTANKVYEFTLTVVTFKIDFELFTLSSLWWSGFCRFFPLTAPFPFRRPPAPAPLRSHALLEEGVIDFETIVSAAEEST